MAKSIPIIFDSFVVISATFTEPLLKRFQSHSLYCLHYNLMCSYYSVIVIPFQYTRDWATSNTFSLSGNIWSISITLFLTNNCQESHGCVECSYSKDNTAEFFWLGISIDCQIKKNDGFILTELPTHLNRSPWQRVISKRFSGKGLYHWTVINFAGFRNSVTDSSIEPRPTRNYLLEWIIGASCWLCSMHQTVFFYVWPPLWRYFLRHDLFIADGHIFLLHVVQYLAGVRSEWSPLSSCVSVSCIGECGASGV